MLFKKFVSISIIVALLAPTFGCLATKTQVLDPSLERLSTQFEWEARKQPLPLSASRVGWINALRDTRDTAIQDLMKAPSFVSGLTASMSGQEMETYLKRNQLAISQWQAKVEYSGKSLREIIYDISKASYESTDDREISRNYALLLLTLHYHRAFYQQMIETAAPLVMMVSAPAYQEQPGVMAFRKSVTDSLFAYVGAKMVTDQDISKVLTVLNDYRKSQALPSELVSLVSGIQKGMRPAQGQGSLQNLTDSDRSQIAQAISDFRKNFEGKSLLYTSGAKRSAVVDFLAWVGNLSWGGVNSMIGVGIILVAVLASPFLLHFPSFSLSSNGKQIYVDLTPMGLPGKMSMGIFEFGAWVDADFAAGHEGGHALQSAILGPLYLPVILATYAIFGFDQGPMEDWAWAWQDA